jgi:hypothetical protein
MERFDHRKVYEVEIKLDSRACGTYTAEEKHVGLWWENLRQSDQLQDLVVNGRIMLKLVLKK